MSSLAAARADNFYYPPSFDPNKHKSLNKFNGQHALRERAKKIDQGILVIRFEVPFNIWCGKCGELIGKGVRFNAEKKQVGNYLSTKIWSFSMHHHCGCRITIQTDPKNAEYLIMEGARKKVEEYTAADAEVMELADDEEKAKLNDPFYKLEAGEAAKVKAVQTKGQLIELKDACDEKHKDNYSLNKALRAQLRASKKEDAKLDARRQSLGLPETVKLLPETEEDLQQARLSLFATNDSRFGATQRRERHAILTQSIFHSTGKLPRSSKTTSLGVSGGMVEKRKLGGGSSSDKLRAKAAALAKRQRA